MNCGVCRVAISSLLQSLHLAKKIDGNISFCRFIDLYQMLSTKETSLGIYCDLKNGITGYSHASLRFLFLGWVRSKMLTAPSLEERQTAIADKSIGCGLKDRKFYSWLLKVIFQQVGKASFIYIHFTLFIGFLWRPATVLDAGTEKIVEVRWS